MPRHSKPVIRAALVAVLAFLVTALTACATRDAARPEPVASAPPPAPELMDTLALVDPATGITTTVDPMSGTVLRFASNSAELDEVARQACFHLVQILHREPGLRVIVAGHADERGSSDYNLELALKRATSVANHLVMLGVQASQVETVSYGEERPHSLEAGEAGWALNRRVEISFIR